MRLLIVTQAVDLNDPVLGFFHGWISGISAHVDHVTVICLRRGAHALPENVEVLSLGKEDGRGRLMRGLRFLSLIIGKRKAYDSVLVHMNPEYVVIGGLLWRLMRKRVALWYVHRSVNLKLRIATFFVHVICTSSPESFRLPSKKVRVLGHGIETAFFRETAAAIPGDVLRIGTSGRLSQSKRPHLLLQVGELLHKRGVALTLSFAGPLPEHKVEYERALNSATESASFEVSFTGPIPHVQMPDFLATLDVFVNLSETQSLDKAVLEAIAMRVPTVTTNQAFAELLPSGAVLSADASAQEIADALLRVRGTDMARYAQKVRESHALQRLLPKIIHELSLHSR